ncbi:hypothetical protein CsSME_00032493 [Camellia sinensis var. sinensis]
MPLRKPHLFLKSFSTSTPQSTSLNWRTQLKQSQLISQISSTLLQRRNWAPLLSTLNLSSSILTPPLFLHILHRTQSHPQLSLTFFNWARTNLGFKPDLKTLSKLNQILICSSLALQSKPILDSLIQTYPPTQIVDSAIHACRGTDSQSPVLGSVLECYCNKGFFLQALEVYRKSVGYGYVVSIHSCNVLFDALQLKNEIRLAWCFYGSMLRNGILPDRFTWSIIAHILCKDGKFERIVRVLDMGMNNSVIYNLTIDCYSKIGNFRAAFDLLNEMCNRKLDSGFGTYSSILDGACKYGDNKAIEMAMDSMMEKGLLPKLPLSDCDLIIQKLSELGRTYVMDMFFKRACDGMIELQRTSYGCMLRAFSKEGRVKEAIGIYREMLERDIKANSSCYNAFVNVLCKEEPSEEINGLLKDIIGRGFSPCALELSIFITSQCAKHRWREAEQLLNAILEKGLLPDSSCCCSLVKHYCASRRIDSAIALHNKMEKLNGILDVTTYNVLLNGLLKERRVEEAVKVFDYMRTRKLLSGDSFSIMISVLCQEKELRKAMKMHDEMLKMGLKPDEKTYKRLISGFK